MKVFLSSDLEGAAGIVDWDQCRPSGGPRYAEGCRLLLGEVNAVIEGAIEGGASSVLLNDSHGAMANLSPESLAGGAEYLSGKHKPLYMMQGLDDSFDAVMFVAYHGSIGSNGTLSHTYNPRAIWEVRLEGEPVGESGINALVAAGLGVPIVFLSGDQLACREIERVVPDCERVAVKESITRFAGRSMHPEEARRLLREGAARAVRRVGEKGAGYGAVQLSPEPRLEIDWLTADMAELATCIAGVDRVAGRTVAIAGSDLVETYKRFVATIAITRSLVES